MKRDKRLAPLLSITLDKPCNKIISKITFKFKTRSKTFKAVHLNKNTLSYQNRVVNK